MITKEDYRGGMARLAAAVNIISSDGPAGLAGFTASAVCSVTDDPPTLLLCVNLSSRQSEMLRVNGVLCVNSLAYEQTDIAKSFSTKNLDMEERFSTGVWTKLSSGSPVLTDALAAFDCRIVERLEKGTHAVLFCEVLDVRTSPVGDAMVYFDRAFHRVEAPAAP